MKKEHRILTLRLAAILVLLISALSVAVSLTVKLGFAIGEDLDVALPLFLFLAFVFYRKAKRLFNNARKLAQPSVDELLEKDRRPHVLYLRSILITFTTTAGALAFATHLFFNSILGMFGLTTT